MWMIVLKKNKQPKNSFVTRTVVVLQTICIYIMWVPYARKGESHWTSSWKECILFHKQPWYIIAFFSFFAVLFRYLILFKSVFALILLFCDFVAYLRNRPIPVCNFRYFRPSLLGDETNEGHCIDQTIFHTFYPN